jgi:uncharacterized protein (DUF433 family)
VNQLNQGRAQILDEITSTQHFAMMPRGLESAGVRKAAGWNAVQLQMSQSLLTRDGRRKSRDASSAPSHLVVVSRLCMIIAAIHSRHDCGRCHHSRPRGRTRVAWIDDTRIKVIEVAMDWIAHRNSAEEMHLEYPHLSVAQIHAAHAFYHDHKTEFDKLIAESLEKAEKAAA